MIEVDPQPRIDVLCEDAATRDPRRLTTYAGTAWYGGRLNLSGSVNIYQTAVIGTPFFVPDSLPYDPAQISRATVSVTVAMQGAGSEMFGMVAQAGLVPDPEGRPVAWLQVHATGKAQVPMAISYRVDVIGPPQMVLPPG